ncbi:hypothetical protein ACFSHP_00145 [Novosphingobium panipatense]
MPALIVRGLSRTCSQLRQWRRWRGATPAFFAVEVPRVGHAPILDEPVAFAAIDAFLQQHMA